MLDVRHPELRPHTLEGNFGLEREALRVTGAGRMALFCGTPCQVAAMKAVAGPDADKLYTVDFFCHGVPPQRLFEEYVDAITNGKASSARNISFRLKDPEGWKPFHIRIDYEGGCHEAYGSKDPYFKGFVSNLFLRKSCGNCRF